MKRKSNGGKGLLFLERKPENRNKNLAFPKEERTFYRDKIWEINSGILPIDGSPHCESLYSNEFEFVFRAIDSCYFIFVLVMNKNYALL